MNHKNVKWLRKKARTSLKSSKLSGSFEREEYMRQAGAAVAATHKQVRRAVRMAAKKFEQKAPTWAQRLEFKRQKVETMVKGVKQFVWRNLGLTPVPS